MMAAIARGIAAAVRPLTNSSLVVCCDNPVRYMAVLTAPQVAKVTVIMYPSVTAINMP